MRENIAEVIAGTFADAMIVTSIAGSTWLIFSMYYTLIK